MPGIGLRLLNGGLRVFARPRLRRLAQTLHERSGDAIIEPDSAVVQAVAATRRRLTRAAALSALGMPAGVAIRACALGGVDGLSLTPRGADAGAGILYLHGGGYVAGTARLYRGLAGRLATAAGCRVFVPDYRLAPEFRFPAAFDDAVAAYAGLCEVAPRAVAIAGDSAGGGLAVALAGTVATLGLPRAAGLACMSPWTDLTGTRRSARVNAGQDSYLEPRLIAPIARLYLGDAAAADPRASPIFADPRALPPLALHVGATEILLDDTLALAASARAAGVEVRLEIWPAAPHGFQLFAPWLRDADTSLRALGAFLGQRLRAATRVRSCAGVDR